MSVYSLGLEGSPGADIFPATVRLWVGDLWASHKCNWHESDAQRIREAFQRLRGNSRRWPQQTDFWGFLPPRKPGQFAALPATVFTEEQRKANIGKLAALMGDALGVKP